MTRIVIIIGLVVAIVASMAGFPFEPMEAYDWGGFFFLVFALALLTASLLLAIEAGRSKLDLAAVGFVAVALYGLGTTLNGSLFARGLPEVSVGIQPGIWAMLALGLLLVSVSGRFAVWISVIGVLSAVGHFGAAVAVLFGAEMPHTGAAPSDVAPLVVAVSKLLFWVALIGWIRSLWLERASVSEPASAEPRLTQIRRPSAS